MSFLTGKTIFKPYRLIRKTIHNHNTNLYRFELPALAPLNCPTGHHLIARGVINDQEQKRHYTPITTNVDWGYFDLLIKTYKPNEEYGDGGDMSRWFGDLVEGDEVEFAGPTGKIEYLMNGEFRMKDVKTKIISEEKYSQIGMICGGTGITPLYTFLKALQEEIGITTSLLFANRTEEDILLRKELEQLVSSYIRVRFALEQPPPRWRQSKGRISEAMIQNYLPPPSDECLILHCGNKKMNMHVRKLLENLGYPNIFKV